MNRLAVIAVGLCCLVACTRPLPPPPPPPVGKVVVLPPRNRTGLDLVVAGSSLIERYALRTPRVTVTDLLEVEMREALGARGVDAVPAPAAVAATSLEDALGQLAAAKLDGAALFLDVWRWEPDTGTQPAYVIVGVDATLVDVGSKRTLWQWHRPQRPIRTPGAVTSGVADEIAVRALVAEIADAWKKPR